MSPKNRHILGCFDTVEKVVQVIRDLKEQGFSNDEITLVSREDYVPQYAKETGVPIHTEEQVLERADSSHKTDQTLWDTVTDTFAIEKWTTGSTTPNYRTDDDPLYSYQSDLDHGCVVVMVDGAKWERSQGREAPKKETRKEEAPKEEIEIDAQSLLDAEDAMRSNVIMSTGSQEARDSDVGPEDVEEGYLHDNSDRGE